MLLMVDSESLIETVHHRVLVSKVEDQERTAVLESCLGFLLSTESIKHLSGDKLALDSHIYLVHDSQLILLLCGGALSFKLLLVQDLA